MVFTVFYYKEKEHSYVSAGANDLYLENENDFGSVMSEDVRTVYITKIIVLLCALFQLASRYVVSHQRSSSLPAGKLIVTLTVSLRCRCILCYNFMLRYYYYVFFHFCTV